MEKQYPINWSYDDIDQPAKGLITHYPWDYVEKHRERLESNHGQTVERLAERGGLHPGELYLAMMDSRVRDFTKTTMSKGISRIGEELGWFEIVGRCRTCGKIINIDKTECQSRRLFCEDKGREN